MNILNYDIKKTKLFKKIMISICSMIMVFASCFAPYSKVKALVGIDDVALSYVALSVLGLCGITLAGTTLSNTDMTKLGSDVAGSISRTFDTLGKTVSDKWNLLVHTAGATGKIALDYVNDLKGNIQDWWNGMSIAPTVTPELSAIMSGLGVSSFLCTNVRQDNSITSNDKYILGMNDVDRRFNDFMGKRASIFLSDLNIALCFGSSANYYSYLIANYNDGYYTILPIFSKDYKSIYSYAHYKNFTGSYVAKSFYTFDGANTVEHKEPLKIAIGSISSFNIYKNQVVTPYFYSAITDTLTHVSAPYLYDPDVINYIVDVAGSLDLDSLGGDGSDILGKFKLDDRVLGATGALALTDKIIGAVGSLDLDLTNNVVNSYGYVDVPSTTLDYPYTGTWDSTLDGIGAIAWAPSTDIPIADTNVIAPTLPGTTDTDIPKVKDFTGKGTDLTFDWKGVFPFCIPFDLIAFLKCLCAEPQPPKIDIPFNVPIVNYKGSVSIDLSKYDEVAALCRTLFDLLFIVGLAYATRYLIKG